MGSGTWLTASYCDYSKKLGRVYSVDTGRVKGQTYTSSKLDESLDPSKFTLRECVNSDEHPNTIPVILALDVTGSMGSACKETAEALNVIITNLYEKFKDIEICVMGVGDLSYDSAPIQMSQFESDIRIAEALDKIWMEHGGGGNSFESYSVAWYLGLHKTKLDCFDKQGRKGIIITMGDEPLNPYLPKDRLNRFAKVNEQADVETETLYKQASEKFDIFHIAVDSPDDSYFYHKSGINRTFGKILGNRLKTSSINTLAKAIEECITESVESAQSVEEGTKVMLDENGEISW